MPERRANGTLPNRPVPRAGLSPGCATLAYSLAAGLLLPGGVLTAEEIGFREIEIRSFLGEPLNLRIPLVVPATANLQAACFSIVEPARADAAAGGLGGNLGSAEGVLSLTETRGSRHLQLKSRNTYGEPVARFTIRMACPGEVSSEREFIALLDPAPFTARSAIPANADAAVSVSASVKTTHQKKPEFSPSGGQWVVRDGDTLQSLARALHPKNRARQAQYREALRALNPALASVADDMPLAAGSRLRMPDLYEISGILPVPAAAAPTGAPATAKPGGKPRVASPKDKPAAIKKTPAAPVARTSTAPEIPSAKVPATAPPPPTTAPSTRQDGFRLRLSGSEMDLSRSRNVTEEQRSVLREKQMILDSDDQVAALLSLKHTVKQLEMRLNEMQLRMASMPAKLAAPAATASAPNVAAPAAAPAKAAEKAAANQAPSVPLVVPVPSPAASAKTEPPAVAAAATAPSTAPKAAEAAPVLPPVPAPAQEPSWFDRLGEYAPSPMAGAGILAGLIVLVGGWLWARRRQGASPLQNALNRADQARQESIRAAAPAPEPDASAESHADSDHADWTDGRLDQLATATMQSHAGQISPTSTEDSESFDVTVRLDTPLSLEDSPARFELDASPATTVDFPLGMEDKAGEDRVRRLQYMYERYPELMSHTVSIDDADSVLNAARLYYEEDHRDKASELLTFAVEERPQEIRFWLAQFEIFRLENMVADFAALAAKFHVLFSHTSAWPKVRHIGHELDPTNPLFAAAGRDALTGELQFDPVAENWLNAPMDFTSEALMSDLRRALFDDHGVDRPDFESITARLAAGADAD